jgi:DNA primase
VFDKSRNLYGLNAARVSRKKNIIVCEGYMDVISMHQAGFTNAVASLGTALTSQHASLLKRYTDEVILSYDSDEAGQKAADKAFRLLQEVGIDVKILKMNDAKDPDEYIRKFGSKRFSDLLEGSRSRFEFEVEKILSKLDISVFENRIKASSEICKIIATYPSNVERDLYCQHTSKLLEIPLDSLKRDVNRAMKRNDKNEKTAQMNEIYRATSGIGDRINPDSSSNLKASKVEEAILGLMQLHEEHLLKCSSELTTDDFVTGFNRRVFEKMIESFSLNGKFDIAFVEEDFNINEISRITKMMVDRQGFDSNGEEVLETCITNLKAEKNKKDASSSMDSLVDLFKSKK